MEVVFECVYTDTEEQLRELYTKLMYQNNRKWITIAAILAAVFAGIWFIERKASDLSWTAICLFVMIWYLTMPFRRARIRHREALRQFNGSLPESRLRFADQIQYRDGEIETFWPYHSVKNIIMMKTSIALENHMGMIIQFPKNNFTKGTPSELLEFLKIQCPQLNIPDWKW